MKSHRPGLGSRRPDGFSIVELLIVVGITSVVMMAMMTLQQNQVKSNNFLQAQLKRNEVRAGIVGQVLNDANNCGCLFKNANPTEFPATANGVTLNVATPPTAIGPYNFTGVCPASSVAPLIDSVGIDGIKATSIQLTNIKAAGASYTGHIVVGIQATKEVLGPSTLQPIDIQVSIATTPGTPGNVQFASCSTQAPPPPPFSNCQTYSSPWVDGGSGVTPAIATCPADHPIPLSGACNTACIWIYSSVLDPVAKTQTCRDGGGGRSCVNGGQHNIQATITCCQ